VQLFPATKTEQSHVLTDSLVIYEETIPSIEAH